MRRVLQLGLLMLALGSISAAQQVVDRIIATVNGQPILLSDWDVEMRFEALLNGKSLPLSNDAARAALQRLIDHELLRQQFRSYRLAGATPEQIDARVAELRKQIPAAGTEAGFSALLARYGLNETEFRDRVANQAAVLRFIDVRLRPSVHVDRRSIEAYYRDTLLPELQRKGAKEPPLAEVSSRIQELLAQQRVDTLTADWLKDLRQQSDIHIDPALEPPSTDTPQPGGK